MDWAFGTGAEAAENLPRKSCLAHLKIREILKIDAGKLEISYKFVGVAASPI